MSPRLTSRSPDLLRLVADGYDVVLVDDRLMIRDVPYVMPSREIGRGQLVSTLELQADVTTPPQDHKAHFIGAEPCDGSGYPLEGIINARGSVALSAGLTAQFTFSSKPTGGYRDYHHKMTTYIAILESEAQVIDPEATSQTYPPVADDDPKSVFRYRDTASTRAGISTVNEHLAGQRIGIVGLGGTGSYIFDQVVKTPVAEIHMFDRDRFSQHNAFRSPGAATLEELERRPSKVEYLARRYDPMRRGLVPHPYAVTEENMHELTELDFVFIAIDSDDAKTLIRDALETADVGFVDVGIGIDLRDGNRLGGLLRTTLSVPDARVDIPVGDGGDDIYSANIQTADLNMLNAALAVIAWKRTSGFYDNVEAERTTHYAIDTNEFIREGRSQ
ncbi:MAG TPA: ThiF family adenylyltransferase [Microthrixaceae bacterium]|nr:ThiF family adenylyltransferase [Microthrixaceae bacterium]